MSNDITLADRTASADKTARPRYVSAEGDFAIVMAQDWPKSCQRNRIAIGASGTAYCDAVIEPGEKAMVFTPDKKKGRGWVSVCLGCAKHLPMRPVTPGAKRWTPDEKIKFLDDCEWKVREGKKLTPRQEEVYDRLFEQNVERMVAEGEKEESEWAKKLAEHPELALLDATDVFVTREQRQQLGPEGYDQWVLSRCRERVAKAKLADESEVTAEV